MPQPLPRFVCRVYRNLGLEVALNHIFGLQEAEGVLHEVVLDGAVLERDVPVLGTFAEPGSDPQGLPGYRNRWVDIGPKPDRPGREDAELNVVDEVELG